MDCGDAGHILLSKRVAGDLWQYSHWQPPLHDCGQVEVKHGVQIHIVNLVTPEAGNAEVPQKIKHAQEEKVALARRAVVRREQDKLSWDPPWNQNMISEAGRMKLGMV